MTAAKAPEPWKPPRPTPELQPATHEQAREYMSWFNRGDAGRPFQ